MFSMVHIALHNLVYNSRLLQEATKCSNDILAGLTNHDMCNPLMQKYA